MTNNQVSITKEENNGEPSAHKMLIEAMEQNRALLARIYESGEKTRKYIFWLRIAEAVKLTLIIIPLALGLLFVAPLLKNFQNVLNLYTGGDVLKQ